VAPNAMNPRIPSRCRACPSSTGHRRSLPPGIRVTPHIRIPHTQTLNAFATPRYASLSSTADRHAAPAVNMREH
jgi:hypothetical protein